MDNLHKHALVDTEIQVGDLLWFAVILETIVVGEERFVNETSLLRSTAVAARSCSAGAGSPDGVSPAQKTMAMLG